MRQAITLCSALLLFGCGQPATNNDVARTNDAGVSANVSTPAPGNTGSNTPVTSAPSNGALSVAISPEGDLAKPGDCLFIYKGEKLIDGRCTNLRSSTTDAVLYGQPNFLQITQDHDGWYSASYGQDHADEDVDELLHQRGDCYLGKHTLACLWTPGDRPPSLPKML